MLSENKITGNIMKINQLKAGAILSYIQMGLNVIIGIIYTPIMIRLLGQSEYGVYSAISKSSLFIIFMVSNKLFSIPPVTSLFVTNSSFFI